ncbi:MAG: ribonuclease H-like domain-containing protein [Firmicutes bacterium]|nr:ribonuclease H-like domain-containing protein [Bacillota bacterium]
MKTIERELDIDPVSLRIMEPYFKEMSYGVFDIETTGLSPVYSIIMLAGFVTVRGGKAVLKQFFARTPSEEPEVIKAALAEIASLDFLVTFNGKMFDLPFLSKRAAKYGLLEASAPKDLFGLLSSEGSPAEKPLNLKAKYDLDLFVLMKYYSDLGSMIGSLSQKNLEAYMGIDVLRRDEISGEESVRLYNNYVSFPTREAEEQILLHNSDDVCQLTRLLGILTRCDLHRALSRNGFPVSCGIVKSISINRKALVIKGVSDDPSEYFSFPSEERPYNFYMSGDDGSFEITVPCESEAGALYVDAIPLLSRVSGVGSVRDTSEIFMPREIAELPGFTNGYLVIKNPAGSDHTDWLGINLFARHLTERIFSEI